MKKFNKASLVIAPMALILFSSSLNIPKVMADDNSSWSDQVKNEQSKKDMASFLNTYDNKSIEKIAIDTENKINSLLNDFINYLEQTYIPNITNKINTDEVQKDKLQSNMNDANKLISSYKEYAKNAVNTANKFNTFYENISTNENKIDGKSETSKKVLEDIKNAQSDASFIAMKTNSNPDFSDKYNLPKDITKESNNLYINYDLINKLQTIITNPNNESVDLDDEIIQLKNQLNNINNTPSNYIPVSNNSNVNNNNDALKNELNNAKNNINNIINKNVELSNTTSSLKNEIEILKQQVHELKNNKKSKHKNTKANKRALNQKKKELNKVNKELKKHIRKSNKKKLIQKRNSILKSIKKLNK